MKKKMNSGNSKTFRLHQQLIRATWAVSVLFADVCRIDRSGRIFPFDANLLLSVGWFAFDNKFFVQHSFWVSCAFD